MRIRMTTADNNSPEFQSRQGERRQGYVAMPA